MKDLIIENSRFCLTVGQNAVVKSLISKKNGEELLKTDENIALFSLTQLRPFNNEVKLAYMNKRTTFQANKIEVDGNKITVGFEIIPCLALIEFTVNNDYIAFTLSDLIYPENAYGDLSMDLPPVEEFRMLQLPVKNRENFGQWINAVWDNEASVCVLGTMPETFIDSERRKDFRILTAEAHKEIQLKGTTAAIIVSGGGDDLLDCIDTLEKDYGLPLGVESRRSPKINRSIYSAGNACPANIDEHIRYAKMGGFECILMYYKCFAKKDGACYGTCGDYDFNDNYPNGFDDLRLVIKKIKDAGMSPGIHFLHTHVGMNSRYVKGKADPRLNLTMHFTLARPLGLCDDKIYVDENPRNATTYDMCRVLKFGSELMFYEGYTTERPYHFYGVKRGHWNTDVTEHPLGEIGGQLDVTEYSGTSVYLSQHTNLQEEIGAKLAAFYNCGYEFVYFDGSEGTNPPFEYHIPNAQYRVYKMMNNQPLFCEGAAKAHFSWHFISGGNAFDAFKTPVFKRMIDKFPFAEAVHARQDFTRLNFGWWSFFNDTQKDVYEYGNSRAFAWDCPITLSAGLETLNNHPRVKDIMEVMRRWEDARKRNLLTEAQKAELRVTGQEHTLLINEMGDYELVPYFEVKDAFSGCSDLSAFVFERGGRSYAVIWHKTGEATVSIGLTGVLYESDLGKEKLPVSEKDGHSEFSVSNAAYISLDISISELESAIKNAKII